MSSDLESGGNGSPHSDGDLHLSIVVPAFNEEARIGATLNRMQSYFDAQGYPYEILVVSDGSTDGTQRVVEQVAARCQQIRLLSYAPNRGKGYAVRYGMLRAQGRRVLFSDADLATPIEEVEKLSRELDRGFDIAIGSRDMRGSELMRRQSLVRELGGKSFNKLVRLLTVPGIHDTQCGFKLFTRASAQAIFSRCQVDHFAFDVEVLYLAMRLFGLKVSEIPVRWTHQEGSKVKFWRDGIRMVKAVFLIRTTRYRAAAPSAELHPR